MDSKHLTVSNAFSWVQYTASVLIIASLVCPRPLAHFSVRPRPRPARSCIPSTLVNTLSRASLARPLSHAPVLSPSLVSRPLEPPSRVARSQALFVLPALEPLSRAARPLEPPLRAALSRAAASRATHSRVLSLILPSPSRRWELLFLLSSFALLLLVQRCTLSGLVKRSW
ncbi:hypothetical protein DENSPDRAFT_934297 [Dentipellis sp. KUC8613]|nr:hypothetical protein DENSPDRAFT_934297 [Dentipellis sp. KUC8613]